MCSIFRRRFVENGNVVLHISDSLQFLLTRISQVTSNSDLVPCGAGVMVKSFERGFTLCIG